MQLSAELHLLLLLSHPHARSTFAIQVQQLLSQTIDYAELQRLIDYHRVWNSIALNVLPIKHQFPSEFCSWLANQQRRCMQQTLLQLHIQHQLSELLSKQQIDHRFIKGTELARRLYGEVAWRYSRDIDLLVHYSAVQQVEALLGEQGYQPIYASWHAEDPASQWLLAMQKDNGYEAAHKPVIEVHHRVSNLNDVFSKEVSAHLLTLNEGISILEYLYLCWHALLSNCHRTKWLVDLAVYRERLDNEIPDWRITAAPLLKRYRLTVQIDFIDFLLAELFGLPAPKAARMWMPRLSRFYVKSWQVAEKNERAELLPILLQMLVQHSIRNLYWRFKELLSYPNPEDRQYINRYYPRFGNLIRLTLPIRKLARYISRLLDRRAATGN